MTWIWINYIIGCIGVLLIFIAAIRLLLKKDGKNPPNKIEILLAYIGVGLALYSAFNTNLNLARFQGRAFEQNYFIMSKMAEITKGQEEIIEGQKEIIEGQKEIIEGQKEIIKLQKEMNKKLDILLINQEKEIKLLKKISEK